MTKTKISHFSFNESTKINDRKQFFSINSMIKSIKKIPTFDTKEDIEISFEGL